MDKKIIVKYAAARGRRVNATPESDLSEEVKLEVKHKETQARRKQRGKVFAVIGTVLVWLPILMALTYIVFTFIKRNPQHFLVYLYVCLACERSTRSAASPFIGAKQSNELYKPIGWIALSMALIPLIVGLFFSGYDYPIEKMPSTPIFAIAGMILVFISECCALALNVFSILLLRRVYRKELPSE
ncbi:MAG: hypothetical protein R2912_06430 [Eubacteriales bacterium]